MNDAVFFGRATIEINGKTIGEGHVEFTPWHVGGRGPLGWPNAYRNNPDISEKDGRTWTPHALERGILETLPIFREDENGRYCTFEVVGRDYAEKVRVAARECGPGESVGYTYIHPDGTPENVMVRNHLLTTAADVLAILAGGAP